MTTATPSTDLFVHTEDGPPRHVQASADEPLAAVLKRAGLAPAAGTLVFTGDAPSAPAGAALDRDDGEDEHEPVDLGRTVAGVGLGRGGHVHCHSCRRIRVAVNYTTRHARHNFSPAATVAAATDWARRRFKLSDADAENFILQVCDSTRQPRPDERLGELVAKSAGCQLCFDLVPEKKIEG